MTPLVNIFLSLQLYIYRKFICTKYLPALGTLHSHYFTENVSFTIHIPVAKFKGLLSLFITVYPLG